ncbi:MAG: hypothetical protein ACK53V_18160, partial [Planctomycetota bacterium]
FYAVRISCRGPSSSLEFGSPEKSNQHMDELVLFRDEIVSISFLRNRSMSIDWMNSLIIVTFMSVWVLIGQFSFIKQ